MSKSLKDDVIIVTGASRGIGAATALELSKQGAKVVLAARSRESLEPVTKSIQTEGGDAVGLSCDVTNYAEVEKVVKTALEHFGKVTALINNAGIIEPLARLENSDTSAWERAIEINLVGAYHSVRAVLPHFYKQGRGVIINLSSGAAQRALEGMSAYCVSKAGLAMLTKAIAVEVQGRGIAVYGFAPGRVDTDMQTAVRAAGINELSRTPREELFSPDEVAKALAWFCANAPQDLSGQELDIRDATLRQRIGLEVS
jgi:3-oxoacyl-[acyl-carrier protein] reductase